MFENVSLVYFKNEPMYKQRFSDVWLLKDVPNEYGIPKIDVGVDLVAKERITGDLVAIQCKYYAPSTIIQKGHIDSFLNEIGKKYFSSGIIVASSPRWSSNAESALKDRDKKIARIGFEDLLNSHIDWSQYSPSKTEVAVPLKPAKTPRPHQVEALEAVLEGFKEHNRGKLIMAPGTGKTYTSLQIAEQLAKEKVGQFRVLYLVPSIQLLSQSLRGWAGDSIYANDMNTIAVCSDRSVTRKESESTEFDISVADIGYQSLMVLFLVNMNIRLKI
ncbi:DEAD/DEAH box helicase family protein [Ruoffia sp. FAM 26254]|uniref:restriction endonuclease n=1 Tax=Ruoffia sp. FAM 26254 TaxID=3259518 RepID=UPI003887D39B